MVHAQVGDERALPQSLRIVAEGLPAESFLDTGNRDAFIDAPAPALHPNFARRAWDETACAPLHEGGALVVGNNPPGVIVRVGVKGGPTMLMM